MSEAQEHPAGGPAETAAGGAPVRSGPRHAAPRKSAFTRYRMPAGKAIALAAMPTAVFTVMGMMPKLALAEDAPKNPFSGDKCVEQSDEPKADASTSPDASESPKEEKPEPSASPSGKSLLPKPETSSKPLSEESSAPKSADSGDDDSADKSPSPSPSETKNPLDPLGLGDKLGDLLGTNDDDSGDSDATATPKPSPTTSSPKPTADPAKKAPDSTDSAERDSSAESKSPLDALKPKASEKPETPGAKDGSKDEAKDDDGKKPFPCPTNDPKAVADADVEKGIPPLSDTPYVLDATKLTLYNLDYKGVVKVRTASGKIKPVLKYETSAIDIKDMKQSFVGGDGATGHVDGGPGTTSKFRHGTVTLYTEEMKGNLFGLIPVTFSPTSQPPPIPLPIAMLTDVKVTLAAQFGGTLTVPGLHLYNTK